MRLVNECLDRQASVERMVHKSLSWIPEIDRSGIDRILIMDEIHETDRYSADWHHFAEKNNFPVSAVYSARTATSLPHIILYMNAINLPFPRFIRSSAVVELYLARIVAHEIAHHLASERGYIFAPGEKFPSRLIEEEFADRYAFEIWNKMKGKLRYRIASRVSRHIAEIYYKMGSEAWIKKNYREASSVWYKSWLLDPEDVKKSDWFWLARKMMDHS